MEILYAVLVLLATGIVAGVLLALASHYMSVPVDEREVRVRANLPGANCGACGYTGCDAYAAALASGEAKPNLCVPGGSNVANAIACELGIEAGECAELMPYIHCNGTPDAALRPAEYEGHASCAVMTMAGGGPLACKYGCLGGGDCADACPVDAICVKGGIARIDRDICISCGICASVCPKHIISMIPKSAAVAVTCSSRDTGATARKNCKNACIACKKCERTCEWGAIKVVDNLAVIDYEKCVRCGKCAEVCPTGCIASLVKNEDK
ncbi:MAG: RnfABCDGE type electron transport complex subunit B [Clostridia bacterium]|nr:RnfABCDGE type electron transport complex subunit B [Clostridia bacterium]